MALHKIEGDSNFKKDSVSGAVLLVVPTAQMQNRKITTLENKLDKVISLLEEYINKED